MYKFLAAIAVSSIVWSIAASARAEQESPRIVNVINFIRGVEPRLEMDLLKPVAEQVKLARQFALPTTFLIQYDAMVDPAFLALLKDLPEYCEIGGWFEVVQPQVEAAGMTWRGRYPWDWHTDVGFSVGYTPEEREKLVDVFMAKFKETFGAYPKSVGSWFIDAHTLAYMADKYGIIASCNCKDQIGTDGYTLWGGYWNQAYYPSRLNSLMPAQSVAKQIPVPVFRMLGSDPIYQYDAGLGSKRQHVVSLEPVYKEGGGKPSWVRWFFEQFTETPCLGFHYSQVGQENSFGWPAMGAGLTDQMTLLNTLRKEGKVRVETLATSGAWYRKTFPITPTTSMMALNNWAEEDKKTVWYNSTRYRSNLFWEKNQFKIRDMHLFDENYAERYLKERVTTSWCIYDTLPLLDGFSWSCARKQAAITPVLLDAQGDARPFQGEAPKVVEQNKESLLITWPVKEGEAFQILVEPKGISFIKADTSPLSWGLEISWDRKKKTAITELSDSSIAYQHNDYAYTLGVAGGRAQWGEKKRSVLIQAQGARLSLLPGHTE